MRDNKIKLNNILKLGVRDLVSYAYRHGGLSEKNKYYESYETPTSIHSNHIQAVMKKDQSPNYFPECYLKTSYTIEPIQFDIRGRADLISVKDNTLSVLEIKTIMRPADPLPESADILHIAQAKIYAYLFCNEPDHDFSSVQIIIRYIHAQTYSIRDFTKTFSYEHLKEFFEKTCKIMFDFTHSLNNYRTIRDSSIKNLKFPYPSLRLGQKDFMNSVLGSIRSKTPLCAQAPTGIGKTISVLYPAIKGIREGYSDYIFYLTAKTSTQNAPISALNDLRKRGLILKSIRITSKQKLCPCKEIYCDTENCIYAKNYYTNSSKAIGELFSYNEIDADILTKIALKYSVCPFEIGLDISLFCDIIICDYNYVFDPRVMLTRFFSDSSYRFVYLVDEAHNLPDRSNEMYSSSLCLKELKALESVSLSFPQSFKTALGNIIAYFFNASSFLEKASKDSEDEKKVLSYDKKISQKELFTVGAVCASRKKPGELLDYCEEFINESKQLLNSLKNWNNKKILLEVYFDIRFFMRTGVEFFNKDYVTLLTKDDDGIKIRLKCLNASEKIASFNTSSNSSIYFSATLSPEEYYTRLFSGKCENNNLKRKILPSPFPPENLWVGAAVGISTNYDQRPFTVQKVASMIFASSLVKRGNYMVFSPSFAYQKMLLQAFKSEGQIHFSEHMKKLTIIEQKRKMNEIERSEFLNQFHITRKDSLIGFSVLGGVFGEGIDLVGDKLSGVILIGVGLPGKSFEQDIVMDYFNEALGNGFDYAYKFPGFNKILQAAGRVIRTETDRGFILLIDERYKREDYIRMFPEEWNPVNIDKPEQLKEELQEFFID